MSVKRADELIAAAHTFAPEATFTEPWQARAFAVAVALCESGQFKWSEFQQCLIEEIGTAEAAGHATVGGPDYYRHWLSALTRLLEAKRIIAAAELATSIAQAGPPPPPQDPRGRHN